MMNEAQIRNLFIRAAEVDQKLPDTASPARLKAMNLGYVHTFTDMNGWKEEDKYAANWAWLDPKNLRATTNDVGIWEAAMEVMKLVHNHNQRRALWAWAKSEAGGKAFAKWCKTEEGISRQLGDWRQNAAVECIFRAFQRKPLQNNDNASEPDFTNEDEIGDKQSNIRVLRQDSRPMACSFDTDIAGRTWAEEQNARRRQREAKRRQAA